MNRSKTLDLNVNLRDKSIPNHFYSLNVIQCNVNGALGTGVTRGTCDVGTVCHSDGSCGISTSKLISDNSRNASHYIA